MPGQRAVAAEQSVVLQNSFHENVPKTMVFKGDLAEKLNIEKTGKPQLLMSLTFGGKSELTIGRSDNNDISLDGLGISNRHARLLQTGNGIVIEDLKSTNGVYLNGKRISRQAIAPTDSVQVGSFEIKVDLQGVIGVFDTRSKTRIDCVKLSQEVKNRAGGGMIKLLDDISLCIQPNEFVGLLGPSGAGKSTLMDALNGMRPASGGSVLINNLDLYENIDSFKQSIGHVPQEDIIHRELSVYRTLYYVAKLRLSRDVSGDEIDQIINEVLDVTGLTERKDVAVSQLSGGQRKRVSIAVELITKPSVIFLDEPTSGLDPATEEKIMKLFRQIAGSGRTVILTTHAMENVRLFDKIVVLMRGKLVFYGKPEEALAYIGAKSFKELYDKLEEPIDEAVKKYGEAKRLEITDKIAEDWKQKFLKTPTYKANVFEPLKTIGEVQSHGVQKKRRLGIFGAIGQFFTLSRRYLEVLFKDKFNLFILFAQAPIVALLTFLVMNSQLPRDFVYFVLSLVSVWFGTSVAAREIIRERPIYKRERMVNLGLLPYLFSKLFILSIIVGLQCFMLFYPRSSFLI
ncbi:MAG: ATP-binding cassette domain-containing protein [Blastocatellia bacterium]|nr:ATP-binding cassette domain-containing protein [Blastocatellia bacterium]